MTATAKVFTTGNSQAIRLPKAFRLQAREVWITRDEASGGITLHPKPEPGVLQDFLAQLQAAPRDSAEFVPMRDAAARPDPLADWSPAARTPAPDRSR